MPYVWCWYDANGICGCMLHQSIGAVNTIIRRRTDGKLIGYNTDCEASITAIEDALKGYHHWHYNLPNQLLFFTRTKFIIALKKYVFLEGRTSDIFQWYLILEVRCAERKIHALMLVNKFMMYVVPYTEYSVKLCTSDWVPWLASLIENWRYLYCQYRDVRMGKQLSHLLSLGKCLY